MATSNPLLEFPGLLRFDAIEPAHVTPAIDELLTEACAMIEAVAADARPPTWDNVVTPLVDRLDRLDRAWSAVRHLNAVVNTPALREAVHANLPKVTSFYADLGQDVRLFGKYRGLKASPQFAMLDAAERRMIDNEIRDFRLGGAELSEDRKAWFKAIQQELADLAAQFDEHLLDTTNTWSLYVERESDLAGIPADVKIDARSAAEADGRPGWKLTLRMPCYLPVMQYADNRELRRTLHYAFATRASELGMKPEWNNAPLIDRILRLRKQAAQLLGYSNFAELSLVPKMAQSPEEVLGFLRDLGRRSKPYAERDYAELTTFARDELGMSDFAPWDHAYAAEKLKASRYAFSEQEVRQYFPEDKVLAGLFRIVETLYGVTIRAADAPVWHPAVRFFEMRDRDASLVGQFYFDLYARAGKQGGAWMDDAINRRRIDGSIQHPVAYMTCNLSSPSSEKPATFTHREVITLFHEFGHGLHHLLTQIDVPGVSGLQGVEWDAVELPSQFMENFCWEWDVIASMSAHVDTAEPLPRALFDRMLAARNFESGMAMARQIEMALFDMLLHAEFDPDTQEPWESAEALLAAVRREVAVVPRPDYDRFINSFTHIFEGGYAAGYYSYKWAEVLSADAYSVFEEQGVLSPGLGARFRDEVLARGGSRPALDSFVAFRGRPPQLDALLRQNGMTMAS
ncbi:MAG TPA: M3 family metallopeptidase [Casimicrobiaceae bacterium]